VPNIAMEDQKPLSEIRILILDDVQDTRTLLGTAVGIGNLSAMS
jgi:hypoxanthine phosphoribosyltransferase